MAGASKRESSSRLWPNSMAASMSSTTMPERRARCTVGLSSTRTLVVHEPRTQLRRWHQAGIGFPKPRISIPCHEVVKHVANGPRYDPKRAQQLPCSLEMFRDTKCGSRARVHLSFTHQYEGGDVGCRIAMSAQEPSTRGGLHGRELKSRFGFVSQYELDGTSAEIAYTVEDHDVGHLCCHIKRSNRKSMTTRQSRAKNAPTR
jgi:hypothetical protein